MNFVEEAVISQFRYRACFILFRQPCSEQPGPDIPSRVEELIVRRWVAPVKDGVRKIQCGVAADKMFRHPDRVIARHGT
ncbi:hypothetical protein ATY77_29825 [Rhizobium sp. R634]|nr:hypothetical protein ATY77_29825 [Rhizobium sp. R634]